MVIAMTNVFKIRHGKETHVYRTEVFADKKSLLGQFRHIADELATKRRKEREGEHERRKTMWGGNDASPAQYLLVEFEVDAHYLTERQVHRRVPRLDGGAGPEGRYVGQREGESRARREMGWRVL